MSIISQNTTTDKNLRLNISVSRELNIKFSYQLNSSSEWCLHSNPPKNALTVYLFNSINRKPSKIEVYNLMSFSIM